VQVAILKRKGISRTNFQKLQNSHAVCLGAPGAVPDAFAGISSGTITCGPPAAQAIPALYGSMLVTPGILCAVLAYRVLRAFPGGTVNVYYTNELYISNSSGRLQQIKDMTPLHGNYAIPTSGSPQCTLGPVVPNGNYCFVHFGLPS
jgi:hypothetical protein